MGPGSWRLSRIATTILATLPRTAQEPAKRAELRSIVEREPGITVGDAHTRLGVGWGTFYQHLFDLRTSGTVSVRVVGRRCLLYTPDAARHANVAATAILRGPTARRIAAAIAANPGCDVPGIAHATGDSPRVVYYHVKRLVDAHLVHSRSRTRHHGLTADPSLATLLDA